MYSAESSSGLHDSVLAAMQNFSIEESHIAAFFVVSQRLHHQVTPAGAKKVKSFQSSLAPDTAVNVTFLPGSDIEDTIQVARAPFIAPGPDKTPLRGVRETSPRRNGPRRARSGPQPA